MILLLYTSCNLQVLRVILLLSPSHSFSASMFKPVIESWEQGVSLQALS